MALILLRHTRPVGCHGRCYGRTDVGVGCDVAAEAARIFGTLPSFERVVTSPLTRCRTLAVEIAHLGRRRLAVDERLMELDFGAWENLPWDDVPRADLDAWAQDLLHARPHGGEAVAGLCTRVGAALAELRELPGSSLVVTHSGVVRAALALSGAEAAWTFSLGFGAWVEV